MAAENPHKKKNYALTCESFRFRIMYPVIL